MKRLLLTLFTLFIGLNLAYSADRYWVSNVASNWNNTANWSTTTGGAGGASVPVAGDFVYFNNNGTGNCTLDVAAAFDGINTSNYTGVIDLNGLAFNPSTGGTAYCVFDKGTITDGTGTQSLSITTSGYVRFSGGVIINIPIIISANGLRFDGGTFNSPVDVTLTGSNTYNGAGGCTFNSTFKVTTAGSNYFLMGITNPDIFNGDVTLINNGASRIRMAYNSAGNQFNGNITVGSTAGFGVWFGESGGSSTLAATKTISIDAGGFSVGDLEFRNFTQVGNTAQSLTCTGTARIYNYDANWGGDVSFIAPRIVTRGTTYNRTSYLEKTGAGNDNSSGGNIFVMNAELKNDGSAQLLMGQTNPDDFQANLILNNTGTSYIYLGYSSIGNSIAGTLTVNNSGTGSTTNIVISHQSSSSLTVTGDVTTSNTASSTNSNIYIGHQGDITLNGNLSITNNPSGTNGYTYIANGSSSNVVISGNTTVLNSGAGTIKRVYIGNSGDVTLNGTLAISNASTATNSKVYCNHSPNSVGLYNDNITVENTNVASDGISFGENGGQGTLAATKTITISAGDFVAGDLEFRNFTQVGNTAQNLTCTNTGTARIYNYDSNWGGDIDFRAPRIYTRGTTYNRTCFLEKTGAVNDASVGGNIFKMNTELKNSGSGYFLMGNGSPDDFQANLIMNSIGTNYMYLAYNSAGNSITGTLTVTNTSSGSNTGVNFCNNSASTLSILGASQINNFSSANNSAIYFPRAGTINQSGNLIVNNNTTGTTGRTYLADASTSSLVVSGNTTVTNSGAGTTKQVYIGNQGDVTFNGTLAISNNGTASNSRVYCNYGTNSVGLYNDNITVENTNAASDGITFGQNGGQGTLAATKTITISAGDFVAGELEFRNFTQVGNTAQSLTCTNTGTARIYNYDSNWGGDITFIAPRMLTRGTIYNRTSYLEKTGANSDYSVGGNIFIMNSELKNSGSAYFGMGNGNSDDFQANLVLNNEGTSYMYLAYNSIGNTIGGTLIATNSGSGSNNGINFCNNSTSTLSITGTTQLNNTSSANNAVIYFPFAGTITQNNNLTVSSNASGATGRTYLANTSTSSLVVSGNSSITNSGAGTTKLTYIGNQGDITFNGTLAISNTSTATNSRIYCNYSPSSIALYNENITVENTNTASDGVTFGQNNGQGTLAATKTITISAGGFVAGDLEFRNFTQVGNTAQNLTCTGTARIYNYDSNWGGDIDFRAPQMITRGTTYNRTSYLEKTGAINDYSVGGNTFVMNAELKNSGSAFFVMGNGNPDDFQANLIMNNVGASFMYLAYNSAGNTIAGTLTATNTGSGSNTGIYYCSYSISTITISGTTQLSNIASSNNASIYFPYGGIITQNNNLTVNNNSTGTTGRTYLANSSSSSLTVSGNTSATNSGAGFYKLIYFGNQGDVTFNGALAISNSSTATNSRVYCNYGANSSGLYNDNITVENINSASDGITFGQAGGIGTLAATKTITISAGGFVAGDLEFRNFTQVGNTTQTLTCTGTARIYNYDSNWGGDVTFIAPRMLTRGTTYNRTSYLEKNGANNDNSLGGNTFVMNAELKNSGSGYFITSNTVPNDFNGNATYTKTSTGTMYPTYNCASTYAGDITVDANSTVRFGASTNGRAIFDGTAAQSVNKIGATPTPEFRDVETQNPNDEITLNTPIIILVDLDLQQGNLISTTTNLIYMNDNSIVSNVSDNAYVDGPLEKIGNDTFTFPVGKSGVYRPIGISNPASGAARFRGEFFAADVVTNGIPDLPVEPTIHHVSDCEYWILDRIATTNSVNVTLSYKNYSANNCSGVVSQPDLKVARWDGGIWRDHGNGGTTGTAANGTVVTSAPVTSFSPFTLATLTDINPLPIELLEFTATNNKNVVDLHWQTASEVNNDYFTVERSADGENFEPILKQNGAGNSSSIINYYDTDKSPLNGTSYYRLKQTDFDGEISYSGIVSVTRKDNAVVNIYPNPVNDRVNISVNKSNYKVNIYSLDGKLIYTDANTKQIDMSDFANGIYQVVIIANDEILETIKVVKQ